MAGTREDTVIKAFPPIGKYRIRLLQDAKGNEALDIREYIEADSFEGFTRRGIRLDLEQSAFLAAILKDVCATEVRR
jgi:hypothetical protein